MKRFGIVVGLIGLPEQYDANVGLYNLPAPGARDDLSGTAAVER
jgi:hypothetical protein